MKLSQRIAHERLTRICFIDYDREMALVADRRDPDDRRARDPRRRPAEQAARHGRGRVRPAGQRPLPGPGAGHRAAAPADRDRPRRAPAPDHRRDPAREPRHAAHLPEARLPPPPRRGPPPGPCRARPRGHLLTGGGWTINSAVRAKKPGAAHERAIPCSVSGGKTSEGLHRRVSVGMHSPGESSWNASKEHEGGSGPFHEACSVHQRRRPLRDPGHRDHRTQFFIGRSPCCQLQLGSPVVSRVHAMIERARGAIARAQPGSPGRDRCSTAGRFTARSWRPSTATGS